jgi:lauroyl/myristoyl acyltransferase
MLLERDDAHGQAPGSGNGHRPQVADASGYEQGRFLSEALERVTRAPQPPPMPAAPLAIRAKTSPLLHGVLPARLAVSRAARKGQVVWERSAEDRAEALAAMEVVIGASARAGELQELARRHFIERSVDRALFWQRPWSAKVDALSAFRLREALSGERGVLLSACHTGPYYRLQCAAPFDGRVSYIVPGEWFFVPPSPDYWGRRLARWHKGMRSRPVPAKGSFRVIQALLERGEPVFLFFDMPGPRETHYLGKSAMLAEGSAQLAVRADALVLPVRARRAGHSVWVDVAAPLDPRELTGVDQLHTALAARHEHWILEDPAAMEDPRQIGWEHGATPEAWVQPRGTPDQKSGVAGRPT